MPKQYATVASGFFLIIDYTKAVDYWNKDCFGHIKI